MDNQTRMKIAIQGEPGSFSHEAALKLVPEGEIVPCPVSAEVFAALDSGAVEAAVIPIENSLAGSVLEHFDLLLTHDVRVERETLLRIRHNLIALPGVELGEIERVFSHPVALAQCRRFLAAHPAMKALAAYDTAGSVKQLVELSDRHSAAIASEAAAHYYGAQILESEIEDNPHPAGASMRRLVVSSRFCFCFFIHGVFVFAFAFVVAVAFLPFSSDSSRASIRTRCEPIRARCLMGPDKDELGLLSKARPITALPCVAVTRTRD
jgi:hypothetical protein